MDQPAKDRLTALAETYKQQKSKLSNAQSDEASSLLAQALLASVGPAHETVETFIRSLPADTTAKAFGNSWTQLSEPTRNHFLKALPNLPRSDRFDRLKLLAAAAIVDVDPTNGLTFLCTACTSLASKSGTHFALELVQLFRKAFLDGQDARIQKLNIAVHPSVVTAALLNLLSYSLLNSSPNIPPLQPIFQLPTVKWMLSSQAYSRLKPTHQTQLVETVKKWDATLQGEVKSNLDLLPSGLPPGFEFLLAPPIKPQPLTEASVGPVTATLQPEQPAVHWKELLVELQRQVTKLDQDYLAASELSATAQAESQNLKASLADAESHARNLQTELSKKSQGNEKAAEALAAALAAAAEAKQNAEVLQAQINELVRKHEEEVAILKSRVETEAAHSLESFQHGLARVLRVDYAHFRISEGKPMTIELGQGLQALLAAIFDRLQKQGINARD